MERPAGDRTSHRRAFAVAMLLSLALHGALLAFVHFGILLPDESSAAADRAPPAPAEDPFLAARPLEVVRLEPTAAGPEAAAPDVSEAVSTEARPAQPVLSAAVATLDLSPARPVREAVLLAPPRRSTARLAAFDAATSFAPASAAARGAVEGGRAGPGLRGAGKGCPGEDGGAIIDRVVPPGRIPPRP